MKTNVILRGGEGETTSAVSALNLMDASGLSADGGAGASHTSEKPSPLEREVARLRDSLAAAEARHAVAVVHAREQGREGALAAFKRDEAAALATLEKGVASALVGFQDEIHGLERLSLSICDTALSKVLPDPHRRTELVSGAILQQINVVKASSVVTIRVSAADFPDQQALLQLAKRLGVSPDALQHKTNMRPGECVIVMQLGQIELSIPDYLKHLQRALAEAGSQSEDAT